MITRRPEGRRIKYTETARNEFKERRTLLDPQVQLNKHFGEAASHWEQIYQENTLNGCIYQNRKAITLRWIEQLKLPRNAQLLEIGCGAGLSAADLAVRGYHVTAVDTVPAMLKLTRNRVGQAQIAQLVRIVRADVRQLPMPDSSFDVVFALGVLPWLDDPRAALREIARVTRPGGYALVTADNQFHLNEALDPRRAPFLEPIRRRLAPTLRAMKLLPQWPPCPESPPIHRHSLSEVDSMLAHVGLVKLRGLTIGFGPFTFLGRDLLPDSMSIKVHRVLQAAANRKLPIVSSLGMQYLVMATKGV